MIFKEAEISQIYSFLGVCSRRGVLKLKATSPCLVLTLGTESRRDLMT